MHLSVAKREIPQHGRDGLQGSGVGESAQGAAYKRAVRPLRHDQPAGAAEGERWGMGGVGEGEIGRHAHRQTNRRIGRQETEVSASWCRCFSLKSWVDGALYDFGSSLPAGRARRNGTSLGWCSRGLWRGKNSSLLRAPLSLFPRDYNRAVFCEDVTIEEIH